MSSCILRGTVISHILFTQTVSTCSFQGLIGLNYLRKISNYHLSEAVVS